MTEASKEACECGGKLIVHHSRTTKNYRVQYVRCKSCGAKQEPRKVPNELAVRVADLEARLKNLEESFGHR